MNIRKSLNLSALIAALALLLPAIAGASTSTSASIYPAEVARTGYEASCNVVAAKMNSAGAATITTELTTATVPTTTTSVIITVLFGKKKTVTNMNWHEAWEQASSPDDEGMLPPDQIEYRSTGNSAHTFVKTLASDPYCQDAETGSAHANIGIEFKVSGEEGQSGLATIIIDFSSHDQAILDGGGTADAILYKSYDDHGAIYRALCTTYGFPASCQKELEKTSETVALSLLLEAGKTYQIGFEIYSHADVCNGSSEALSDVTVNSIKIDTTAAYPAQVLRTGQTTCYDASGAVIACTGTGQDGEIQAGAVWPDPRFDDNGDGTVTDKLTGLAWANNANLLVADDSDNDTDGTAGDGLVTWQHALDYIKKLNRENYLGYNDWRLPNINELESLANLGVYNPAFPAGHPFTNVQSFNYWSSTSIAYDPSSAWVVGMHNGVLNDGTKTNYSYVWPVRSGQCGSSVSSVICLPKTGQTSCFDTAGDSITCTGTGQDGELQNGFAGPSPRFVDNGETVTDSLTGLEWTKNANLAEQIKTWQEALDYVKKLNTGGHTDWRLPNERELRSLADYSKYSPALDAGQPFANVQSDFYWSSTSISNAPGYAWVVGMGNGDVENYNKVVDYSYVWPVRTGQVGNSVCPATQVLGAGNPELDNLRYFRDSTLASSAVGRKLIMMYYDHAADINAALDRSPALRAFARRVLETVAPMLGRKE